MSIISLLWRKKIVRGELYWVKLGRIRVVLGGQISLFLEGWIQIWLFSRKSDPDPVFFLEGRIREKSTWIQNPHSNIISGLL